MSKELKTRLNGLIIAIDGPAGSGKSTVASRIARKHGYLNIETGALYRALALQAIMSDVSFDDEDALMNLAQKSVIKLEPRIVEIGRSVAELAEHLREDRAAEPVVAAAEVDQQ